MTTTTTSKEDITTFSQELLTEHNRLRSRYGAVSDLELDDELSAKAQSHADSLAARQCKLENSTDETVGENLYYLESEDGKYTAQHIVEYWLKRSNFDSQTRPTTTNHFTQIVWKASKKLGVGVARASNGAVYVAAFYFPRGNVVNYLDENVLMKEELLIVDKNATTTDAASSSDNQNGSGDDSPKPSDGSNGTNKSKDGKTKEKKLEDKAINMIDKIMKKADKEKTGKISLTKAKKIFQLINEKFHTEYSNMDAKKFFEQFDQLDEDGRCDHKLFKKALVDLKLKLPTH